MWKEDDLKFEVKLVLFNHNLNTLTLQLTTGDKQFYIVKAYIPPNCMRWVEDLRSTVEACLAGCKLVMGYLNVNTSFPPRQAGGGHCRPAQRGKSVDTLRRFWLRTPCRTATRAQWMWSQKRGMM
jgi:hypothetical protein